MEAPKWSWWSYPRLGFSTLAQHDTRHPEKNRARRHFVHDVLDVTLHDLAFRLPVEGPDSWSHHCHVRDVTWRSKHLKTSRINWINQCLLLMVNQLSATLFAGLPGITKRFNDRSNLTTGIPSGNLAYLWTMAPVIDSSVCVWQLVICHIAMLNYQRVPIHEPLDFPKWTKPKGLEAFG